MGFNLPQWLSGLPGGLANAATNALSQRLFNLTPTGPTSSLFGLPVSNSVVGAGLMLGANQLDQEPGEVTQARQYLRNEFTSPTAITDQFTQNLSGIASRFQPLLDQQRQQATAELGRRYANAFPGTAGAQGPEFGGLAQYLAQQALPTEQALNAQLGLSLLGMQRQSAADILNYSRPNPFAQGLAQLGGSLINADMLRQALGSMGGGPGGQGGALGALAGQPFLSAVNATSPVGQAIQQAINAGLVQSPAAQPMTSGLAGAVGLTPAGAGAGASAGLPGLAGLFSGQGLLGAPSLGSGLGMVSGLASGGLGYAIGNYLGPKLPNQSLGTAAGAASGAAAGFAVGGPIGGVIGAIAGGLGSLRGKSSSVQQQKQASIQQETAQTDAQRPAALQMAAQVFASSQAASQRLSTLTPQLNAALSQPAVLSDPQIQQLIGQLQQQVGGTFTSATGGARSGPVNSDVILHALQQVAGVGGNYDPAGASNPESHIGLLMSTETGKFGPGTEFLQQEAQQQAAGQQLVQAFISRLQQLGVLNAA